MKTEPGAFSPVRQCVNVPIPPNFSDNNPERGPWHDPDAERPAVFIYVQVLYTDGVTGTAVWTGNLWWSKGVVEPIGWRPTLQSGNQF